ncbi:MAG: glycoside hydrolase [Betaproteobacteria bacterium]|nr:glycoside hydrolase [Betaproteobacteria bacterium]
MSGGKLEIIFLWHMHQPDYRDHARGEFTLPWVYLHALKDYTDMAAHLERHPRVRAVVNFVPVLLDQIEDYGEQFASGNWRDPLLRLLAAPDFNRLAAAERKLIIDSCFRTNHASMIEPFPRYKRLRDLFRIVEGADEAARAYLSGAYLADLITWYHLTWAGETERRRQPLLAELMTKGEGYTADDRKRLVAFIGEAVRGIIPRYRALAASGQIELSTTPHTHPLAPLLIDFASAREAEPAAELPGAGCYPGGRARTTAQLESALASHAARFGAPPAGVWPAEGAISNAFLKLLAGADCRWTAASESVLAASLRRAAHEMPSRERYLYRPYRVEGAPGITVFFRDEKLSDLIGFEYRHWHGKDAAADFAARLHAIRRQVPEGETAVATVILDGENAWEHYPYNGHYFFEDLYTLLEADPELHTTTCADYIARYPDTARALPGVVAGSWVYGTFSTWIGHPDKNRAWDLLCAAKQTYDLVTGSGRLNAQEERAAAAQLAVCESSDWFWWFGGHNPAQSVASFDRLFRLNLSNLYHRLKVEPPAALAEPVSHGGGEPEGGGTMRRAA